MKMDSQYIICFLDILGYGDLIEENYEDVNLIIRIENIIRESLNKFEGFQKRREIDDITKAIKTIYESISFRVISDSTIIKLPLSGLPSINVEYSAEYSTSLYIKSFLDAISMYVLYVSSKLGYFFRGGITIGQYYENQLNRPENTFVLSKALDDAVTIEKKAKLPRIIIEQNSYNKILNLINENKYYNFIDEYFTKDCDGKYYLHIYNHLHNDEFLQRESILNKIKNGIKTRQTDLERKKAILDIKEYNKIRDKYIWLINYHNKYIPPDLNSYKI